MSTSMLKWNIYSGNWLFQSYLVKIACSTVILICLSTTIMRMASCLISLQFFPSFFQFDAYRQYPDRAYTDVPEYETYIPLVSLSSHNLQTFLCLSSFSNTVYVHTSCMFLGSMTIFITAISHVLSSQPWRCEHLLVALGYHHTFSTSRSRDALMSDGIMEASQQWLSTSWCLGNVPPRMFNFKSLQIYSNAFKIVKSEYICIIYSINKIPRRGAASNPIHPF